MTAPVEESGRTEEGADVVGHGELAKVGTDRNH